MTTLLQYKKIINNFKNAKIGVIGDIVADITIFGRPTKLSREAPVIVIKHESESISPGGAGNTVNNISKLGAKVYPVSLIGNDASGNKLVDYFSKDKNVDTNGLFINTLDSTTTKTRILAGDMHTTKQQVLRIDKEPGYSIPVDLEKKIIAYINKINKIVIVWVVSDYGYNMVSDAILKKIKQLAKEKVVIIDSRKRLKDFKGVTIAVPNESEVEIASGVEVDDNNNIFGIGKKLLKDMSTDALLITRGNHGMALFEKNGKIEDISICGTKEVTDVTGAGDTVVSILSIAYASGATPILAARLSNYGAAVVVMKSGTATLTQAELIKIIEKDLAG
ncbi:MAG: bifunctional heptose 7-phosphate kinase/heptose 1-phosphate adenyltransferase [Candidatus Anammoxibacter sp.]